MDLKELVEGLNELFEPKTHDEKMSAMSKVPFRCCSCEHEYVVTQRDRKASQLVTRYINQDHVGGGRTKDQLLEQLKRVNEVCKHVSMRTTAGDELMFQASRTLSSFAEHCSSFKEFSDVLKTCDYMLRDPGSKCSIPFHSLLEIKTD